MSELFHTRLRAVRAPPTITVRELIARGARRLHRARLFYGHGTDNAWDEAAALTLHALDLADPQKVLEDLRGEAENYYDALTAKNPNLAVYRAGWLRRAAA